MLVRSASTPVLGALHASSCAGVHSTAVHFGESSPTVAYHPPPISCSLSAAGACSDHERSRGSDGGLRRACSDGNLSSLGGRAEDHHLPPLETIQSFTARDGYRDEEEEDDDEDAEQEMSFGMFGAGGGGGGSTYTAQEHPLFLARGLGIDRLGSGLFSADGGGVNNGGSGGAGGGYLVDSCGGGDHSGIEAHYKQLIEEDPCNGLFLRNYAQFLYQVNGDRRRAEEYYSRAILADPDGELLSEYAKLVWEVHRDEDRASSYFDRAARGQGVPAQQPRPRRAGHVPLGHGRRRRRARRGHELHRVRRRSPVHGFGNELIRLSGTDIDRSSCSYWFSME